MTGWNMPVMTQLMWTFFVTPKKTVINITIQSYLADQWANKWENTKGHAQTKFWFTGPDPILASKLLNMFREHLGWCIQFFTSHGWWKKTSATN